MTDLPPHIAAWARSRSTREAFEQRIADALWLTRKHSSAHARVERARRELKAEPISTAIGLSALIFNAGAGALSVGAASAIGGAVISLGASIALSAAASALAPSPASSALQQSNDQSLIGGQNTADASSANLSQQIRQPQVSALPDQRLVLGEVTTSGIQCGQWASPPYLWRMYILANHQCGERLLGLYMAGDEVPLSAAGFPLQPPFYSGGVKYLQISYRDGSATQEIDPIIAADIADMPSTFRQRNACCVTIKANYGADDNTHTDVYGSDNAFNPLFRFQGASYYDPRVAGCLLDDESTWVRGRTASLNIARAMYHRWPNTRSIDPGNINWDLMAEAADIDDRRAGLKDGTTDANHTCDGVILSSADPMTSLKDLLTSNDGLFICDKGKYHVLSGAPRDPEYTLHQDMLVDGFELHTETPDSDLINIVKTEFIADDRDYKPQVGPILKRDDLIALDGRPLETTLTLPFTTGNTRAQRLGARKLNDSRGTGSGKSRKRALTVACDLRARKFKAGTILRVDFKDFPKVYGIYQVMRNVRDQTLTKCQIDLVEYDKNKYAWNSADEQQDFTLDSDVLAAAA